MSNDIPDYQKKIKEVADTERLRLEVQKRELALRDASSKAKFDSLQTNKKELEVAKNISLSALSTEAVERIVKANDDYISAAKEKMAFITPSLYEVVPFFQKNVILIGGKTGEGKSTTVANIAFSTIRQKDPQTGKYGKVLVLTNEEQAEDVYNRITCLGRGWSYTNHDKFTDEQRIAFSQGIRTLSRDGMVTVIGNDYEGATGMTTSIEGISQIFENLIRDKVHYDAVIIDYYQNIKFSKLDPSLSEYDVQAKLAAKLDQFKNIYSAPIVLMCQVNPLADKDDTTPFQYRIKGRKVIMDVATCVIEMIADRVNYLTQWVIHKSRFNESIGQGISTGFQRGMYVENNDAHKMEVLRLKEQRMYSKANVLPPTTEDKASGLKLKQIVQNLQDQENKDIEDKEKK